MYNKVNHYISQTLRILHRNPTTGTPFLAPCGLSSTTRSRCLELKGTHDKPASEGRALLQKPFSYLLSLPGVESSSYSRLQTSKAYSTMASATSDSNDNYNSKGQQSPLASQRAKQGTTPSEAKRTARFGGYFPLGYKAGFSQWVWIRNGLNKQSPQKLIIRPVGQRSCRDCGAYGTILHSLP